MDLDSSPSADVVREAGDQESSQLPMVGLGDFLREDLVPEEFRPEPEAPVE